MLDLIFSCFGLIYSVIRQKYLFRWVLVHFLSVFGYQILNYSFLLDPLQGYSSSLTSLQVPLELV